MPTAVLEKEMEAEAKRYVRQPMQKVLLKNEPLKAGKERRLLPNIDVSKWDRLHFHISNGNKAIPACHVRVLFATPMKDAPCSALLADSTVWFEEKSTEREFSHTTPSHYNGTGFVMSVPVVAPQLYDVILRNVGDQDLDSVYVTAMAQEI